MLSESNGIGYESGRESPHSTCTPRSQRILATHRRNQTPRMAVCDIV
jgi:hypothetical protein